MPRKPDVILERELHVLEYGETHPAWIRFHRPVPDADGEFLCRFVFSWRDQEFARGEVGVDSINSLQMALQSAEAGLARFAQTRGIKITWEGEEGLELTTGISSGASATMTIWSRIKFEFFNALATVSGIFRGDKRDNG